MQHLEGQNLEERLRKNPFVSRECLWSWARQLVSALYACHVTARLIHRDIKPENIMLNKANEIVLVDFGLSKHFSGEDDQVKRIAGTMLYYAPEIMRTGVVDKVVRGR